MTGLTLPCFDLLGFKAGFSAEKPWLYEDFDQLTFYEVSEETLEKEIAKFKSGTYRFEWEDVLFDMAEHNKLLASTKEEVQAMKTRQEQAQAEMAIREKQSVEKWKSERAKDGVSHNVLQNLLSGKISTPCYKIYANGLVDPNMETMQAPLDANVWKVLVHKGDILSAGQVVVILEAMKLEINVKVDDNLVGYKVELLAVAPGDSVGAGSTILLARKK
jgi:biotin carboxyl carrier protein